MPMQRWYDLELVGERKREEVMEDRGVICSSDDVDLGEGGAVGETRRW